MATRGAQGGRGAGGKARVSNDVDRGADRVVCSRYSMGGQKSESFALHDATHNRRRGLA